MRTINLKPNTPVLLVALTVFGVLMMAFAFHGIGPDEYGETIFRSALFFGSFGALLGFLSGYLAGKHNR